MFACKPLYMLPAIDTIEFTAQETANAEQSVRNLIGGLLYIANLTRPDISAAVSFLSRHLSRPTERIWKYCKQVLRYLHTTKAKKLVLGDLDGSSLVVYADANFAPKGDRKSQ